MGNLCSLTDTDSSKLSSSPCGEVVIFPDEVHQPGDSSPGNPLRMSGSIIRVPPANPMHLTVPILRRDHPGDIQIEIPELGEVNGSKGEPQVGEVTNNVDGFRALPRVKEPVFSPFPERRESDGVENIMSAGGLQRIHSEIDRPVRWKRGDLIGAGAYGRVYLGLNEDTGSLMAVKQVAMPTEESGKTSKAKVAEYVQGLEAEVGVLKQFKHPNIVRYLGTECDGESLNIFLEYVAGGSVASLLTKFGTFQENLVRVFTKQILTGLEFLHKNKIAHRDIKGGNILVDHLGVVKLADFGASKTIVNLVTMNTGFKSLKGTPYWMAPEVIKQTGHGRQADIWSVGCTVIEMVTGKPPWSEVSNNVTVMFHIASAKGPPPIPSSLSPEAQDFLRLCFDRNPRQRPNATRLLKHPFVVNVRHSAATVASSVPIMPPSHVTRGQDYLKAPTQPVLQHPIDSESQNMMPKDGHDVVSDTDIKLDVVECEEESFSHQLDPPKASETEYRSCKRPPPLKVSPESDDDLPSEDLALGNMEAFVDIVNKTAIVDTLRLSQPFIHDSLGGESEVEGGEVNALEKQQQWADDLKVELERMKEHCMALSASAT